MLWPMLLDYTRNECKRYLRKLELEAYASIISAFRAQGELSKDKKKMLHDLCSVLSISMERHKAEIRRAVNDEKLNTIADRMVGPNTSTDWAIEGRRLVPLMPRLVPQTAFTALANNLANLQAVKNANMPLPCETGQADCSAQEELKAAGDQGSVPSTPVKGQQAVQLNAPLGIATKAVTPGSHPSTTLPASGGSNVVVLPSGMAIQLKGTESGALYLPEEEPESGNKKRKRSASLDSSNQTPAKVLVTSAVPSGSSPGGSAPSVVLTTTPSPVNVRSGLPARGQQIHKTTIQGAQGGSKQVILVSGSSASLPPSILQRCLSVPVAGKAVQPPVSSATYKSTATSTYSVASSPSSTALSTVSSVLSSPMVTASPTGTGNMLVYTTTSRPRTRTTGTTIRPGFRPRAMAGSLPMSAGQPGGPGAVQFPTPSSALKIQPSVQKPTTTYLRTPGIYRQETSPGVKILTQNVQTSPVRARSSPSPSTFVGMTTKQTPASQNIGPTPRIVNVMSVNPNARAGGGTSLISTRLPSPTTKLGQAIASRMSSGTAGTKPNVIVVHKAQVWPQQQQQLSPGAAFIVTKSGQTFKDIVTYSQKQQQSLMKNAGGISVMKPAISQTRTVQTATNTVTITTTTAMPSTASPSSILELDPSQLDEQKNTLLADLIQAAGIAPDAAAAAAAAVVSVALETFPPQMQTTTVTTTVAPSAAPVSLVSSIPAPCVAEVAEEMEVDEKQETISTSETELNELGDLLTGETVSFTSEAQDIPTNDSITTVITSSAADDTTLSSAGSSKSNTPVDTTHEKDVEVETNENETVRELEMPMDQMQEGQVLEIQAPDAAALLNSDGQLSKEVLEILHRAGFQLQNDQVTIDTSGLDLSGTTVELHLEGASDDVTDEKKEEDNSMGMLYESDHQKEDAKEDSMPSIVSVFSSGQLDLETLQIVEEDLVLKSTATDVASPVSQQSLLKSNHPVEVTIEQTMECSETTEEAAPQSFLDVPDLHNELNVVEETATDVGNVVVESIDKPYIVPSMSIDNVVVEVGSTELVISGEEVQVDSTTSNVLVEEENDYNRNAMEFI